MSAPRGATGRAIRSTCSSLAVGGILVWGVTDNVATVNVGAVGGILLIVGFIPPAVSLFFRSTIFSRRSTLQLKGSRELLRDFESPNLNPG